MRIICNSNAANGLNNGANGVYPGVDGLLKQIYWAEEMKDDKVVEPYMDVPKLRYPKIKLDEEQSGRIMDLAQDVFGVILRARRKTPEGQPHPRQQPPQRRALGRNYA